VCKLHVIHFFPCCSVFPGCIFQGPVVFQCSLFLFLFLFLFLILFPNLWLFQVSFDLTPPPKRVAFVVNYPLFSFLNKKFPIPDLIFPILPQFLFLKFHDLGLSCPILDLNLLVLDLDFRVPNLCRLVLD